MIPYGFSGINYSHVMSCAVSCAVLCWVYLSPIRVFKFGSMPLDVIRLDPVLPLVASQLTPEEMEKKERRKEQNRRAARKCRMKKKYLQNTVADVSVHAHHTDVITVYVHCTLFARRLRGFARTHDKLGSMCKRIHAGYSELFFFWGGGGGRGTVVRPPEKKVFSYSDMKSRIVFEYFRKVK